jgi:two-component system chemotaxis response regulator CheY
MDILLVDDSKTMRMMILRAIRQAGYRELVVGEAENGFQAFDKIRDEKPRLVVSDWNMPEMSGLDLLRQIRAIDNHVPFGFVTSLASQEMRSLAKDSGAAFMLPKPFTPDDIEQVLSPILG